MKIKTEFNQGLQNLKLKLKSKSINFTSKVIGS